jgi:hypothetical protein
MLNIRYIGRNKRFFMYSFSVLVSLSERRDIEEKMSCFGWTREELPRHKEGVKRYYFFVNIPRPLGSNGMARKGTHEESKSRREKLRSLLK